MEEVKLTKIYFKCFANVIMYPPQYNYNKVIN
jgi:hypothetical protein